MNRNLPRRARNAFTLIELLVVIIILAILAAVVIPKVVHRADDARKSAGISDITSYMSALEMYKADTGQYPSTDQGLMALVANPGVKGWRKPYISNTDTIKNDPWGHPYHYKSPGDNGHEFEITSDGDGTEVLQSWSLTH